MAYFSSTLRKTSTLRDQNSMRTKRVSSIYYKLNKTDKKEFSTSTSRLKLHVNIGDDYRTKFAK